MGDNYSSLVKYYAAGNKVWNYSEVGKGLICEYCGGEFDAHPYKVRQGKAKYCKLDCYNAARANPNRPEDLRQRFTREYKEWKRAVLERDNFTCQRCGLASTEGASVAAHHIKAFKDNPELRLDLDNGVTLCRNCHYEIHFGHGIEYGKCKDCGKRCGQRAQRCRKCDNISRLDRDAERQAKWDRVIVLYSGGLSTREVGQVVGIGHKSVLYILKSMNIETRNHSESAKIYRSKRDAT